MLARGPAPVHRRLPGHRRGLRSRAPDRRGGLLGLSGSVLGLWLELARCGQADLELAALPRRAADARRPAVRVGDRAHQREPEPGPPAAVGVSAGAEPVEDVGELARLDAAAGVADRDPDRCRSPPVTDSWMRSPSRVCLIAFSSSASMARPSRSASARHRRGVEPSQLPLARRGRPPPADQPRPRTRPAGPVRSAGSRDPRPPAIMSRRSLSRRSRVISPSTIWMSRSSLLPSRSLGEEFGVGESDRDRGPQMVRGVLEEPALGREQAAVLLPDEPPLAVGADPPVSEPDDRDEHRRQQRYRPAASSTDWLLCSRSRAMPAERGDDHDAEPPQHRVGGPHAAASTAPRTRSR